MPPYLPAPIKLPTRKGQTWTFWPYYIDVFNNKWVGCHFCYQRINAPPCLFSTKEYMYCIYIYKVYLC